MVKTDTDDDKAFAEQRNLMVAEQITERGLTDPIVLSSMKQVPRHAFVPEQERYLAYRDTPLPIGSGQTISQPYMVAIMTEALQLTGGERVLEIGTGSGYQAAVLSRMADEVYTIERIEALADGARRTLTRLGYSNVHVRHGDGTKGWPEAAPYDAIIVTAGGPKVPQSLREQLKIGGRLVIPVGSYEFVQTLIRVTRTGEDDYEEEDLGGVQFVPLIGDEGWDEAGLGGGAFSFRRMT